MNLPQRKFYPWLVVGLLWFVAMLNYLDRQMLSTMKPSMMIDIAELRTAENFGRLMTIWGGAVCFGFGFGLFDANSMPILCQFNSPRYCYTGNFRPCRYHTSVMAVASGNGKQNR